ncbi:MAG: TIGR03667 family PPOX class F420-dependent oxidoreductase [Thermomicrobiales bacterium]
MITIDTTTPFGARVRQHLDQDIIIWLVTVDGAGTPQPSPVWFLPYDDAVLIFSKPETAKLRNIERNPKVALHFDGNGHGGDIVIITGIARIDRDLPSAAELPRYIVKYADHIKNLNMTNESFAAAYSVPILVDLQTLRGH